MTPLVSEKKEPQEELFCGAEKTKQVLQKMEEPKNKTKKVWEEIKGTKKPFVYSKSPMEKAVEKKQQGIKASMDAKAEQFSIQGSASDATEILKTFYDIYIPEIKDEKEMEKFIKEKWNYWRQWFYHKRADFEKPDEPFIK